MGYAAVENHYGDNYVAVLIVNKTLKTSCKHAKFALTVIGLSACTIPKKKLKSIFMIRSYSVASYSWFLFCTQRKR